MKQWVELAQTTVELLREMLAELRHIRRQVTHNENCGCQ